MTAESVIVEELVELIESSTEIPLTVSSGFHRPNYRLCWETQRLNKKVK